VILDLDSGVLGTLGYLLVLLDLASCGASGGYGNPLQDVTLGQEFETLAKRPVVA
jgi:hypothetical protein